MAMGPTTAKRSAPHPSAASKKKGRKKSKPSTPTPPSISVAKAPAKVILFGEHSVVYPGKRALACALDLCTTTSTHILNSNALEIRLPEVGIIEPLIIKTSLLKECVPDATKPAFELSKDTALAEKLETILDGVGREIPGIARRALVSLLVVYLGICQGTPSLSITASSQIPPGSGLGSSASFCVSLAASLLLHTNKISSFAEGAGSTLDSNLVNEWGLCGETVLHGLVSGVDNTVVCFGGANIYVKGQPLKPIKGFPALRMLLTNTKVEKDTKKQVGIVTHRMQTLRPVAEKLVDAVDAIVGECCQVLEELDEAKVKMEEVYAKMETLIEMNHGILTSLGVSHPTLETIVKITKARGLSSKLTGAGGGGCALTLIREDFDKEELQAVREELEEQGFECLESRIGCGGVSCWKK
ncbi:hypothetical protein HDU98_003898 [Podochytrium sp. JEL0797]|nr:hypothetical protein HDU98_003898 [Podochytrium sp. JEL0797]